MHQERLTTQRHWRAIAKRALRESGLPYELETSGITQDAATLVASFLAADGSVRDVSVDLRRFQGFAAIKDEVIRQLTGS